MMYFGRGTRNRMGASLVVGPPANIAVGTSVTHFILAN
jgi:hypothetical protein